MGKCIIVKVNEKARMINNAKNNKFNEVLEQPKVFCFYAPTMETDELEKQMGLTIGAEAYINQKTAIINREDLSEQLNKIQKPTLIISSRDDEVLPFSDSEELHSSINNSKLVAYSNCGHLSTLESKSIYHDVQEFIDQ